MARYIPPKQSKAGQIFDVLFIIALIFATLWLPIWLKLAGAAKVLTPMENPTWETLQQNPTMASTWEKLGFTPETAAEIINNRFDYTIHWVPLIVMAVALIAYFVFLFRVSDKEYREVIREKFDE